MLNILFLLCLTVGLYMGREYAHVRQDQINPGTGITSSCELPDWHRRPSFIFQNPNSIWICVVTTALHWFPVTTAWPYMTSALMLVCVGTKTVWLSSGQNCQTSWCQWTPAKHTNVYLLLAPPTALNYFPEFPHHFITHITNLKFLAV